MTAETYTPPVAPSLIFDEAEHRYFLGDAELPSVTTVIKQAGLVDYSHVPEFARERGSVVHKLIHYALEGDLDESTIDGYLMPYLSAARQCLADIGAEMIAVEQRVVSVAYRYAGTLDWIGRVNGRLTVIDWKTFLKGRPETGLQTAAYADAWQEMTGQRVWQRYACGLHQEGRYELTPYNSREDGPDFRRALRIAQLRKEWGLL